MIGTPPHTGPQVPNNLLPTEPIKPDNVTDDTTWNIFTHNHTGNPPINPPTINITIKPIFRTLLTSSIFVYFLYTTHQYE